MNDTTSLATKRAMLNAINADVLAALLRARRRAEELAVRTSTALIQAVDGKPVRIEPPRNPQQP
jgi:RNase P/RNase MRP subunit POP5